MTLISDAYPTASGVFRWRRQTSVCKGFCCRQDLYCYWLIPARSKQYSCSRICTSNPIFNACIKNRVTTQLNNSQYCCNTKHKVHGQTQTAHWALTKKIREQKLLSSASPVAEENRVQRRDALILHITYESFSIYDKQQTQIILNFSLRQNWGSVTRNA
jgi:hypothetical protein